MIGIVVSEPDEASVSIGEQLIASTDWQRVEPADSEGRCYRRPGMELCHVDGLHLYEEGVARVFDDPSLVVFVSRHAGETGRLLTAHFPGNVGEAAFGGSPYTVPQAAPGALRTAFHALRTGAPHDYEVGIECTHHGPSTVGAPCLFVEVGSDEAAWADERAARAVARAVLALDNDAEQYPDHTVVGIGGGHYAPRFERILAETSWHVGHIAADWALAELPEDERARTLDMLFRHSGTHLALSDGVDPSIEETIAGLGYRLVSETWLREADGVDLDLVEAIENALSPIDQGTRVGERIDVAPAEVTPVTFPDELIATLHGIDRPGTVDTVAARSTAYVTTENGNRLTGEVLLPDDVTPRAVVSATLPILEARFDAVSWEGRSVLVRERTFDPDRARDLGVPEGPAFGQLADGEPVRVDDTVIEPKQVSSSVERRITALPR